MGEQRDRMLAGELYRADDPELLAGRARAEALCRDFNAGPTVEERAPVLARLLGHLGTGSVVLPHFFCDYGEFISIGDRTFVNTGAVILDGAPVTIGDDVLIGPRVQLISATHPLDVASRVAGWESTRPVTVGDKVWLAAGVIVCPGVTIGEATVVGAGSVVLRDLPAGVLAVGNPARVVREL